MIIVGLLSRLAVRTPRPSLVEATESIEEAMCRLQESTDRLEDLIVLIQEDAAEQEEHSHE